MILKIIASEQRVTKYLLKLLMCYRFHPYWLLVHTEPACSAVPHCFPLSWVEDLKWALWGQMHWAAGLKTDLISMECFEIEIFFFLSKAFSLHLRARDQNPVFLLGVIFGLLCIILVWLYYYIMFILYYFINSQFLFSVTKQRK